MEGKLDTFRKEINFIRDSALKEFAEIAVQALPDYFFTVPASSSGKYHPSYANGVGGLVRHTKAAMRIAMELFRLEMFGSFTAKERDIILVSLLLHDGYKQGDGHTNFSVTEHPLVAAKEIKNNHILDAIIDEDDRDMICENISHHMGQWVFDYKTKDQVLEKPKNKMQNMVHLLDYLASRKCLEFNFDVEISI